MFVRLQCPHCQSVCQIDEQFRGAAVQCGGCGRPFAVPSSADSWWGGLRKMVQTLTGPAKTAAAEDASLSLELDGPAALSQEEPTKVAARTIGPRFEVGAATSAGVIRPRNEDSYFVQQLGWCNRDEPGDVAVLAVADGMGGHAAGDLASGLVLRSLAMSLRGVVARFTQADAAQPAPTAAEVVASVAEAIHTANRLTHQRGEAEPSLKGMGATLAVVFAWSKEAVVAHVGDCRVYHWHGGKLAQLTRDHTVVGRMVELGKLTPAEAKTHPARNEITQAMGRHALVDPSSRTIALAAGDWLVAACDGLNAHVEDAELAGTIGGAANAPELANALVNLANRNGGSDNCTVLVLRCRE